MMKILYIISICKTLMKLVQKLIYYFKIVHLYLFQKLHNRYLWYLYYFYRINLDVGIY